MIDAQSLALFADRMQPAITPPPDKSSRQLRDLQTARRQIVSELSDLKRRLQATEHPIVLKQIKARIAMGVRHKEVVEKEMRALVNCASDVKNKCDILMSVPGIGQTTAMLLVAELPVPGAIIFLGEPTEI
jgi:transposase